MKSNKKIKARKNREYARQMEKKDLPYYVSGDQGFRNGLSAKLKITLAK